MKEIDFKKFLDDKSWDYNKNTIEQMMEKELEKEPEEINMEFVDACMNYLTGYSNNDAPKEKDKVIVNENNIHKNKRIRFSRILIAAAIALIVVSVSVTVYAKANNLKMSDVFVNMFSDHATIDYSEKNTTNDEATTAYNESNLYKELQEGGIENIVLPSQLYSAKYEDIEWNNDFTEISANFISQIDNEKFGVTIETFTEEKWIQNPDIQGEFTNSKKVTVDGIDVYLFEREGNSKKVNTTISYQIDLTQYDIACYYSIEQAENFITSMN